MFLSTPRYKNNYSYCSYHSYYLLSLYFNSSCQHTRFKNLNGGSMYFRHTWADYPFSWMTLCPYILWHHEWNEHVWTILITLAPFTFFRNPDDYNIRVGMFQLSADDYEQELHVKRIIEVNPNIPVTSQKRHGRSNHRQSDGLISGWFKLKVCLVGLCKGHNMVTGGFP